DGGCGVPPGEKRAKVPHIWLVLDRACEPTSQPPGVGCPRPAEVSIPMEKFPDGKKRQSCPGDPRMHRGARRWHPRRFALCHHEEPQEHHGAARAEEVQQVPQASYSSPRSE